VTTRGSQEQQLNYEPQFVVALGKSVAIGCLGNANGYAYSIGDMERESAL
jgi:hypothetical protein